MVYAKLILKPKARRANVWISLGATTAPLNAPAMWYLAMGMVHAML
jgi:hypothetical protein